MTRVLCCAVEFWPETHKALYRYAPHHEAVKVGRDDWRTYGQEIFRRWGQDDLLLVEQDIILHEDVLPQLEACPQPWCVFPYRHPACPGNGFLTAGLGCTRFRLQFQEKVTAAEIAAEGGNCNRCYGQPDKHECWLHLDGRIREAAERLGFTPHIHWPSAGHRDSAPGEFEEI